MVRFVTAAAVNEYNSSLPRAPNISNLDALQKQLKVYSGLAFSFRDKLKQLLDKRGVEIERAWESWNSPKRAAVIRKADSSIPERRRPDFELLRSDNHFANLPPSASNHAAIRKTFLMPYRNVEDLCRADNALMLLYSRAAFELCDFVFTETELGHVDFPQHLSKGRNDYSIEVYGRRAQDSYAEAEKIDKGIHLLSMTQQEGLLALEIQARIYQFTFQLSTAIAAESGLDCSEAILHQLVSKPMSSRLPDDSGSVSDVVTRAPYRHPNSFEPVQIMAAVEAQIDMSTQHVVELQSNPSFFTEALETHRQDLALELQIGRNRVRKEGFSPSKKAIAHWCVVNDAYDAVYLWSIVKHVLNELLSFLGRFKNATMLEMKSIYAEFLGRCAELDGALQEVLDSLVKRLGRCVSSLPDMRQAYYNKPGNKTTVTEWNITMALFPDDAEPELCRLHHLFRMVCDPQLRRMHGLYNLLEELQVAIEQDKSGKQYITSAVMNDFSHLLLAAGLQHEIDVFQPHCRIWRWDHAADLASTRQRVKQTRDSISVAMRAYTLDHVLDSADQRLQYPESDNEQDLQQRNLARQTLAEYWQGLAFALDYAGDEPSSAFKRLRQSGTIPVAGVSITGMDLEASLRNLVDLSGLTVDSIDAAEHNDVATPTSKTVKLAPTAASQSDVGLGGASADVMTGQFPDWSSQRKQASGSTFTSDVPHRPRPVTPSKNQQRRDAAAENESVFGQSTSAAPPQRPASPEPITVDHRAHKTFTYLLNLPGRSQTSDIEWNDILHAMTDAGFTASHSAGSAWGFAKGALKIGTHQPHPSSRVSKVEAQRFGRRLKKRPFFYGEGTFVLRG